MNRRHGITLTEVLVTMFVLAIGLLALLTLFPLAALNMAQAIQDDRVGHIGANARSVLDMYWDMRPSNDAGPTPDFPVQYPRAAQLFCTAGGPQPPDDAPSWPLYIDPLGTPQGTPPGSSWVGGSGAPHLIMRLGTPWTNWNPDPTTYRTFQLQTAAFLDDLVFDQNGVPVGASASTRNTLQREIRYSWAYLMRRPRTACSSIVDVQIVVYFQRSVYTAGPNSGEAVTTATTAWNTNGPPPNYIDITPPAQAVTLRKGIWILDITQDPPGSAEFMQFGPVHAIFYRVQSVTPLGGGQMRLEMQTPLRGNVRQVVMMDNVVEVFDKGAGFQMPHPRRDEMNIDSAR
jgi:hypothetical protein